MRPTRDRQQTKQTITLPAMAPLPPKKNSVGLESVLSRSWVGLESVWIRSWVCLESVLSQSWVRLAVWLRNKAFESLIDIWELVFSLFEFFLFSTFFSSAYALWFVVNKIQRSCDLFIIVYKIWPSPYNLMWINQTCNNWIIHTPYKFDVFCVFQSSRIKGGLVELERAFVEYFSM